MNNPIDFGDDLELFDQLYGIEWTDEKGGLVREYEDVKNHDARHVWTMVEGDDDTWILYAGFHIVNKIGYVLTKRPWDTGSESVIYDSGHDTEEVL